MFQIPTYQECLEICEKSMGVFYETKTSINGYNISIFNYRLASFQDFGLPGSIEMRGITFVFNTDGTVFRCFPLLEKFFNINENESTDSSLLLNKEIKSIYTKEDGSIINFIVLPDNSIHAKSKTSFESDQAILAQNIFETDKTINLLVTHWLKINLNPIFELVGPKNRIVLNYPFNKLILLSLRDSLGNYNDLESIKLPCKCVKDGLHKSKKLDYTLEDLISLKSTLEDEEGWVVEFVDGQKVKIKTDWYFSVHKLYTDFSNREDYLIDFIINEKIDDLISNIDLESENRKFVDGVVERTKAKYNRLHNQIKDLISNYNGDKKVFAEQYKNNYLFGISMKVIGGGDLDSILKGWILKKTYRLNEAKAWLRD
jgi:T4 RnlA family RNA ligase